MGKVKKYLKELKEDFLCQKKLSCMMIAIVILCIVIDIQLWYLCKDISGVSRSMLDVKILMKDSRG